MVLAEWFYRNKVAGESIRSIASQAFTEGDRMDENVGRTSVEVLKKRSPYCPSEVKTPTKSMVPIRGDFEPE